MKSISAKFAVAFLAILLALPCAAFAQVVEKGEPFNPNFPGRLPDKIDGRPVVPDIGCFWSYPSIEKDYREFIDVVAPTNAFDALTLTTRALNWIDGNKTVVENVQRAVEYAEETYGVGALLDIDVRIARYDFEKKRPDLAQERLYFKEIPVEKRDETIQASFRAPTLTDHYTGNLPYFVRGARLAKAWGYRVDENGAILPESIVPVDEALSYEPSDYVAKDLPGYEVDRSGRDRFDVAIDPAKLDASVQRVAIAVAFRYSYPDLFADETLELEKKIYESFRSVPARGVAKDEWGFPPSFTSDAALDDFWYSERMRAAYAKRCDERDLIDELFLAFRPQVGRERERVEAVDRFRRLCSERAEEYEEQNYKLAKEIWGSNAFVGVHCTWYPWPGALEMRKNGIMWWKAPRDVAQVDEYVPFCVRNSLAKGTDSLWINMFYARQPHFYVWDHWTAAASGGRIHLHAIYPRDENSPTNPKDNSLLPVVEDAKVKLIRNKIRILNFVSNSQVDARVAVIFSRFGAANPLRDEYLRVGVDVCDRFATRGYPADLTPIDEINSTRPDGTPKWSVRDGKLAYGAQSYDYVVLYAESDAEKDAYDAFRKLAEGARTKIVPLASDADDAQKDALAEKIVAELKASGAPEQTPWIRDEFAFSGPNMTSVRPPRTAKTRFLDGTILRVAATESDFGDPIRLERVVEPLANGANSEEISVDANGVCAVKFDDSGKPIAFAAAALKSVKIGALEIALTDEEIGDDPVDVALWRDEQWKWRGVFQRAENKLPETLAKIAERWNHLYAPRE